MNSKVKLVLAFSTILATFPMIAAAQINGGATIAGTQSGGGAGTIARLLIYAQAFLIDNLPLLTPAAMQFNEPELNGWYAKSYGNFSDALSRIRFIPVHGSKPLVDKHFGNETWIRVGVILRYGIEFKSDEELFKKKTEKEPNLETVVVHFLHEFGHIFELNESEAWSFARQMVAKFHFEKKVAPKRCQLVAPDATKDTGQTDREVIVKPDSKETFSIDGLQYEFHLNSARFFFEASVKDRRGWKLFHQVVMANVNPASWVMIKPNAFLGIYCNP